MKMTDSTMFKGFISSIVLVGSHVWVDLKVMGNDRAQWWSLANNTKCEVGQVGGVYRGDKMVHGNSIPTLTWGKALVLFIEVHKEP